MDSLLEKYTPKKAGDIVGQNTALMQMIDFLENFSKQSKKAMILHGPSGTGKSASVYALADDLGYDIVELNASDFRNKEVIEKRINTAVKTGSLFGKRKMVFIDEAETFTSKDRGGIPALLKILKETRIPVVLVVFDIWNQKIKSLKPYAVSVEFRKVHYASINKHLKTILEKEGILFETEVTEFIAKNASGDLRSAINDLEIISAGKKELKKEDILFLDNRISESKIFDAVQKIFKTENMKEARDVFDTTNMELGTFSLWVSDNITNEYEKPGEIARAYNYASRADVFSGRILRRQSWELMKYSIDLITAGVSSAKERRYSKFTRYNPPAKILKLYQTKSKRALKKKVCEKLSAELHASSKKVEKHYLPFLKTIMKNKKTAENIITNLVLDKDEASFLRKGI